MVQGQRKAWWKGSERHGGRTVKGGVCDREGPRCPPWTDTLCSTRHGTRSVAQAAVGARWLTVGLSGGVSAGVPGAAAAAAPNPIGHLLAAGAEEAAAEGTAARAGPLVKPSSGELDPRSSRAFRCCGAGGGWGGGAESHGWHCRHVALAQSVAMPPAAAETMQAHTGHVGQAGAPGMAVRLSLCCIPLCHE